MAFEVSMAFNDSIMDTLYRSAVKTRTIRQIPKGLCRRCSGTGYGEEVADLGEARWHGAVAGIKTCGSCRGTGMALAKVQITPVGILLGFLLLAATWPLAGEVRWIGVVLLASAFGLVAILSRYERKDGNALVGPPVEASPPPPYTRGVTTEGILSLIQVHQETSTASGSLESDSDGGRISSALGLESAGLKSK